MISVKVIKPACACIGRVVLPSIYLPSGVLVVNFCLGETFSLPFFPFLPLEVAPLLIQLACLGSAVSYPSLGLKHRGRCPKNW